MTRPAQSMDGERFKKVLVRMPVELLAALDLEAASSRRARTAEILVRLESTFPRDAQGRIVLEVSHDAFNKEAS